MTSVTLIEHPIKLITPESRNGMQVTPVIFVITAVLLVPLVYASISIIDVCAAPPSKGYSDSETCGAKTTNPETGQSKQTCCWKERTGTSAGPGPEITVCQTCYQTDIRSPLACDTPVSQAMKLPPSSPLPDITQDRIPREGVLQSPENNNTFSKANITGFE